MPEPDQPHYGCTELVTGAPGKHAPIAGMRTVVVLYQPRRGGVVRTTRLAFRRST